MHKVLVKSRELQEIVDWAIEGGFEVKVQGNNVIFKHPMMNPPGGIVSGAATKKFDHPAHFKRKLARSIRPAQQPERLQEPVRAYPA